MLNEKQKQILIQIYEKDHKSRIHFPTPEEQLKACEEYLKQDPLKAEQIDELLSDYVFDEEKYCVLI